MPRGEEQKPVTDTYRDGWDRIFGYCERCGKSHGECAVSWCGSLNGLRNSDLEPKEKAPPVRTEPCDVCFGTGYEVSEKGDVASCPVCGGEGVIPLET